MFIGQEKVSVFGKSGVYEKSVSAIKFFSPEMHEIVHFTFSVSVSDRNSFTICTYDVLYVWYIICMFIYRFPLPWK